MPLAVLLIAVCAASANPAGSAKAPAGRERVQILILDLESTTAPPESVTILSGSIASALAKRDGVLAITAADLRAMTEIEASKAAAGCDQTSCLAEIAAALGARYVMYGRLGTLGEELVLQLNLFDATHARAISREEKRGANIGALADAIPSLVDALLIPLAPDDEPPSIVVAGGAVAIAGSVVMLGAGAGALALESSLWSTQSTVDDKANALTYGPWLWGATIAGVVVGTVGMTMVFWPITGAIAEAGE